MKKRAVMILTAILMVAAAVPFAASGEEPDAYELWVGGTQVTEANRENIPASGGTKSGTASFDPETNTLTLDGYKYEGPGHPSNSRRAVILARFPLVIVLRGENILRETGTDPSYYDSNGIYASGRGEDCLVIKDDPVDPRESSLAIEAGAEGSASPVAQGIAAIDTVSILADQVRIRAHQAGSSICGVVCKRLKMNGGSLEVSADDHDTSSVGVFGSFEIGKDAREVMISGYSDAYKSEEFICRIPGKGWANVEGTEGEEAIEASDSGTDLSGKWFQKICLQKKLTITARDQEYVYDGSPHGEADPVYADPAEIAEKVKVSGLKPGDVLDHVVLTGERTEIGESRIEITGVMIRSSTGRDVTDEYDTALIPGRLAILPRSAIVSGTLLAKMTAKGKRQLVLSWSRIKGAAGYDVFFSKCSSGKEHAIPKKVKTIKGNRTLRWIRQGLKKKTAYKAVVKAYVRKNGKKVYVRTSPMVHVFTSGGTKKFTNPKGVTVRKTDVTLKAGKKYQIKANVTKLRKNRKLMSAVHAPKLRYVSSNKKIASVSKSGRITAKAKGSCRIYVLAVNGIRKAVRVTVR